MTGKQLGLLAVAVVFVLFGIGLITWPNPQPYVEGRSLEEWVNLLASPHRTAADKAASEAAIAEMGTNATPHLLRWISYSRSSLRGKLNSAAQKVPVIRDPRVNPWSRDRRERRSQDAIYALGILGRENPAVISELKRLALTSAHEPVIYRAVTALGLIRPEALPELINIATNRVELAAYQAIRAIGWFGTNAASAVPVLIECQRDKRPRVAFAATGILGKLRLEPNLVVPALERSATNSLWDIRVAAMGALRKFGPASQRAIPSILKATADSELEVRKAATNAMLAIAPELLSASPSKKPANFPDPAVP